MLTAKLRLLSNNEGVISLFKPLIPPLVVDDSVFGFKQNSSSIW